MATYYEIRENAKAEITKALRENLLKQFHKLPVIVLRNKADELRANNKAIVRSILKGLGIDDYQVNWRIAYDYRDDADGIARIWDFTVVVEGGHYSYGGA